MIYPFDIPQLYLSERGKFYRRRRRLKPQISAASA
ncbi:MAG: hypothetical protein ACI8VE_002018, partial [Natrialbaceae archaeon]